MNTASLHQSHSIDLQTLTPEPYEENPVLASSSLRCQSAKEYDVVFLDGLLDARQPYLADLLASRPALLVTTPTVVRHYGGRLNTLIDAQALDVSVLELPCSEQSKNLELVARICTEAMELDLDRRGVLIGLGGGVCTDLVTMAASWIRRGIAHIRIPTTLVGQIDAGIGVKGGVNFHGRKSFLGCFYPPEAVLIDPIFLGTLPSDALRCGLAEMLKIALVRDAALFDLVEAQAGLLLRSGFARPCEAARTALWRAADGMLQELSTNAYENQGYQRLVDFGHTFSPVLESATGFTLAHGRAVAIDMALSVVLASELGWLRPSDCERILSLLAAAGLPIFSSLLTADLCRQALCEAARHRGGAANVVLPMAVGRARFLERADELTSTTLELAIHRLAERALRNLTE